MINYVKLIMLVGFSISMIAAIAAVFFATDMIPDDRKNTLPRRK